MKKKTIFKNYLLPTTAFLFLLIFNISSFAQTTLYATDFGSTQYVNPLSWSFTGVDMNISDHDPKSSGYTGASGHCYLAEGNSGDFNNTSGTHYDHSQMGTSTATLLVSTTGYNNVVVSFGMRKSMSYDANANYSFAWSNDGISFTTITFTQPSAGSWGLASGGGLNLPSGATNQTTLYLKWTFNRTGSVSGESFRIDDFNVTGAIITCTPVSITSQPLSPAGICSGSGSASFTVGVSGTGPFTYQWQENSTTIVNGGSYSGTTTPTLTITNPPYSLNGYHYRCIVTNCSGGNSSTSNNSAVLTVNPLPAATIAPASSTTFCDGGSVTLTSSSGTSYLWSNSATTPSINVSASGSYSVRVTDANGCSATSTSTQVTVNPLPTATITAGGTTTLCDGSSVTLTSSSGTSYLWSNSATTPSINVSASGNYSVRVTDANGCSATSPSTQVTVNPLPTATVTAGGSTTFCQGGSVMLTSSTGTSYLWSNSATTPSINISASGSYSVRVTDANGCSATSTSTQVTVNPLPTATITAGGSTTFCQGGSVMLTSSAGTGYLWSTNATTPSINISASGSYSVRVTDANGCSATSAFTQVTVNPLPTATITVGGSTTFCGGGSVILTPSAGTGYLWSTNETTSSINVSASGNYSVRVTDANGCSATSTATQVTVNPLPNAIITPSGPTTFCPGGTVTLSSSPGVSYLWSTNETTSSISVSTSGNFTVQVTDVNGCSATSLVTQVNVSSVPTTTITPSGNPTFCQGDSVTLTATAGSSYLWSNNATTQSIVVSASGNFSVLVTYAIGCSATSTATQVTANPLPTATITEGGNTTFCNGGSVTLTSSSGTGYLWSTNETTSSINVSASGNYSVQVTDANGCSATSTSTQVTVNPLPTATVTAGGNTTFCDGGSVTLTSSLGTGYLWSTNETTSSINVSASGNYSVQVTDANGCSATSTTVQVTVNPLPTAIISPGSNTTFCQGGFVTLNSSPGVSYLWSNNTTTPSINVSASGNYSVQVTDANGCSATSSSTQVTVNPLPTAIISPGGNTTYCQGGFVILNSSPGVSYLWSTNETTSSINVSASANYSVQVTDANGCSATSSSTQVTVNPLPMATITAGGTTTFCDGGSVTLTSSSGASYIWSTNETTSSINVSASGNYSVQVTDVNGCSTTSTSTQVTVNPLPMATITAGGTTTFCDGGSVTLTSSSGASYIWSTNETTSSVNISASGNYSVQVTDANGCSATSTSTQVTVNPLPTTTITPAGNTTFCQGGFVTLNSSSGVSYLWSNNATTSSINISASGNYSVQVTDGNGCSNTSSITQVIVNSLPSSPVITALSATTFCGGNSVTISSTPAFSYHWSNSATTSSIIVTTSGNYSLTIADANGCTASSTSVIPVTVLPLPDTTITPNGPTTFCPGGSVGLNVSSAPSYLWSTGETTQSIVADTTGSFSVTVTDSNGCIATGSIAVSIHVDPTDINRDGVTDNTDFLLLIANFNSGCLCPEDINQDGIIDNVDFLILLGHFNEHCM